MGSLKLFTLSFR